MKSNTRERILEESMKLFSVHGFDAVSIRTIAEAVGITNSGLYKHFASKQAIFDELVEVSKKQYLEQCSNVVKTEIQSFDQMQNACVSMFRYQTEDDWIVMFRRMLILEQFKNQEIQDLYKEFFIDAPVKYQSKIFETLIEQGLMKRKNPEVLAMELYAPFFMYHTVKREETELVDLFEQHVKYFFENYIVMEKVGDKNEHKNSD